MLLVLLLSFIIICLISFIYYLFKPSSNKCNDYRLYKKILYNNVKHDIKSGDLLLFSHSHYNVFTRTFGNPIFSHLGIVVKINNKLNVVEMVNADYIYPGNQQHSNLLITPLYDRITYYSGDVSIASLNQELSIEQTIKLNQLANKKYTFVTSWINHLVFHEKDIRFCSEFIAEILDKLNISSIPYNQYKMYMQTAIVNLCNDTIFKYPVQIISENRLLKSIKQPYNTINYC